MKVAWKIVKWIGFILGTLIALVILAGLSLRIFSPRPQPPGALVDIGGFKLHINSTGKKNHQPTLVMEGGFGLPTGHFHWLSEGLKDSMRVVRYDRAGIGYSDLSDTPRDPKTIAQELHMLLEKSGESPPYILAGHSFGGLYIRVFAQLYPDEVEGLVFLDSSHPDQVQRLNRQAPPDMTWLLKTMATFADMGIMGLYERCNSSIFAMEGLPDKINQGFLDFSLNGRYYKGVIEENKWDQLAYDQARQAVAFSELPIRVFTATKRSEKFRAEWYKMHQEIAELSKDGKHILLDGHHNSIYTKKENADIICKEIIELLEK